MLQEAVNTGNWRDFKLLLRLTSCLGQLFETDGVINILDELFNRAVDLQTASPEDVSSVIHRPESNIADKYRFSVLS